MRSVLFLAAFVLLMLGAPASAWFFVGQGSQLDRLEELNEVLECMLVQKNNYVPRSEWDERCGWAEYKAKWGDG